jgi:hypothetical protein
MTPSDGVKRPHHKFLFSMNYMHRGPSKPSLFSMKCNKHQPVEETLNEEVAALLVAPEPGGTRSRTEDAG